MLSVAIIVCLGWILAVCLHEFGHAIVAYWGGDTSVKDKGYLTLNPLKYTDINLSLILPLIFLLIGGIALPGAAVYINQQQLRNRWWQSAVSAAGPIASAIVTWFLAIPFMLNLASPESEYRLVWIALALLIFLQIYVIIINSLPIPSLDGYGVVEPWLPDKVQRQLGKYTNYGYLFLLALLWFVPPVNQMIGTTAILVAQVLSVPQVAIAEGFSLFKQSSGLLFVVAMGGVLLLRKFTSKPEEVWYNKGVAFEQSQRYEKAIAAYDKVLKIKPNHYELWYKRGLLLIELKRNEEAIASFDRAIQIKPYFVAAWIFKGGVFEKLKQYEEALILYNKAIELSPKSELAWSDKGKTLIKLKRYKEAMDCLNKAIEINPNWFLPWYNKACYYAEQNQFDLAIKNLNYALKLDPEQVKQEAKIDPSFDCFRGNPLFQQLIDN